MKHATEEKCFHFAIRIVNLYKHLTDAKKEYTLAKQLLKSGTSIGANMAEAREAQSTADFISKHSIALKESRETEYWLRLLYATDYLTEAEYSSIIDDCQEVGKMLTATIKTTKENAQQAN